MGTPFRGGGKYIIFRVFELTLLQAFVVPTPFTSTATSLHACRVNAKKEKRMRNRENMRKFMKRGGNRRKQMRKMEANKIRQLENEFVAKLFITNPDEESQKN